MSPVAIGATGSVLREGKRNPSSGAAAQETEMISQTKTYGTRQSNVRDGNGGGAIYGCRSSAGREPCIRANNLKNGRAFEFETDGDEAGFIETKNPAARPFATNATGVAAGLNADRVDSLNAAKVDFRAQGPHGLDAAAESRRPDPERALRGRPRPGRARDPHRCPTRCCT